MQTRSIKGRALVAHSRWLAYATAGAATVAGSAPHAEATIHHVGHLHLRFNDQTFSTRVKLPMTGGASLTFARFRTFDAFFDQVGVIKANEPGVRGYGSFGNFASKLAGRDDVSNGNFVSRGSGLLIGVSGSGAFAEKGTGFVGFKFDVGEGIQYGWLRVITLNGGLDNRVALQDYAWADPGEKIKAGQTSSDPGEDASAVPMSGSLGLLALGGVGLLAWRRRRGTANDAAETGLRQ